VQTGLQDGDLGGSLHANRREAYDLLVGISTRAALLATIATCAIVPVALAGCGGSSSSGTAASPATVVPATAPVYVDAVVQPTGELKTDAQSVGHRLTGRSEPFAGLLKLLRASPSSPTPDYAREVKPWLGPHAGVFLSSLDASSSQGLLREALTKGVSEGLSGAEAALLGSSGLPGLLSSHSVQGALVLDTTDVAKARSFLEAQAHGAGAQAASYRGVSYQVAGDGIAEGIVGRFAVIGSEAGLKSVIDTELGGPSLAQAAAYAKLASTAEGTGANPSALANVYLDLEGLTHSVKGGESESTLLLLRGLLGADQAYISLIPSSSSVALDLDTLSSDTESQPTTSSGTTGAQVLRGLPGNSWLAIGIGDLDREFGGGAQGLRALAALLSGVSLDSFSLEKVLAPLSSHTLNVPRDLLSWMGATGVFASGANLIELRAAVVIDSTDPAASRAAVAKLAAAYREVGGQVASISITGTEAAETVKLANFPLVLTLADEQGKFVIGIGPSSVQEALSPQSTLAGTSAYNAAASALGQGIQPSALVEFHTLLGLLESVGLNQAPGFSTLVSALGPLDTLAAGGGASPTNGVKRARLVLNLQPAS
jgi:hypothetical protein